MAVVAGLQTASWRALPAHASAPPAGTVATFGGGGVGIGPAKTVPQRGWGLATSGTTLFVADNEHSVVRALNLVTGLEAVVAGTGVVGFSGDGGQGSAAEIQPPFGLAADSSGDVFIATGDRIREVSAGGVISTVAGGGTGALGDGGLATLATLSAPEAVALDASGNLFIADTGHNRIRRVDHTTNNISTVAGNGTAGFSGDGGMAISAELNQAAGVGIDGSGNIWIADTLNNRLREVSSGTISTVVPGNFGNYCFNEPAASATLNQPIGVWVDGSSNVFIADQHDNCVKELTSGNVTTLAGSGSPGFSGDGGSALTAQLFEPTAAIVDGSGNLFIADFGNARVREVVGGIINTVAGAGLLSGSNIDACVDNGDGGQATDAILCNPADVAFDVAGDLYIADSGANVVREIVSSGIISTFAGGGSAGLGDGGPATSAELSGPSGLAFDAAGNLFIADSGNNRVREVDHSTGKISTVAGGGLTSPTMGGPATSARLFGPGSVAIDSGGNLFISDGGNSLVEEVTGGNISVIDQVSFPGGLAVDGAGNLYIVAPSNQTVLKRDKNGVITSYAYFYAASWTGLPRDVAVGPGGRVLVSTLSAHVVLVTSSGLINIAGSGSTTVSGDGGPATSAGMAPLGIGADASGDLYLADSGTVLGQSNGRVRRIQAYTAPAAPTTVYAYSATDADLVSWTAPDTGGLPINTYTVKPYIGAVPQSPVVLRGALAASTTTYVALQPGVAYTFTVSAANGWDTSADSAMSNPAQPFVLTQPELVVTQAGSVGYGVPKSIGQYPYSLAVNGTDVYVGDFLNPVIRRVDTTVGQENALAGNDAYGYSGDGGDPAAAMIQGAGAMAQCGTSTYFADTFNYVIRRVDGGVIYTVAGTGQPGYSGDGGPGTLARISRVFGLACRTGGGIYISDADNGAVRILDGTGKISTWWSGFSFTTGIVEVGGNDQVAVSDSGQANVVWRLTDQNFCLLDGVPSFNAPYCYVSQSGRTALSDPRGLTYSAGFIYLVDRGDNVVRALGTVDGAVATAVGVPGGPGFGGDGLAATSALLNRPNGVAVGNNSLYVADAGNYRVRAVNLSTLIINTMAGNGTPSLSDGPATLAQLGNPAAIAFDQFGNEYVADDENGAVRKINPSQQTSTVAGTGVPGYNGDGISATSAQLGGAEGVTVDLSGDIFVSDTPNGRVREVNRSTGLISTVLVIGTPRGLAVDTAGNVYIANSAGNTIIRLNTDMSTTVVAGNGAAGYGGDGGPATSAELSAPWAVAVDSAGNLFIADTGNNRIRRVDHTTGVVTTIAGDGVSSFRGDNQPALSAELASPRGLAFDSAGNLYISDTFNQKVREINTYGLITTVIGICGLTSGFSGDGGLAALAHVNFPLGLATDIIGNLFVADVDDNRVRGAAALSGSRGAACQGPPGTVGQRSASQSPPGSGRPRLAGHQDAQMLVLDAPLTTLPEGSPLRAVRAAASDSAVSNGGSSSPRGVRSPQDPGSPHGAGVPGRTAELVAGRTAPTRPPFAAAKITISPSLALLPLILTIFAFGRFRSRRQRGRRAETPRI